MQAKKEAGGWTHIDVRTPNEYEVGRPAGTVNVPFMVPGESGMSHNPTFVADFSAAVPGKDANIIVSCQSGGRSAMAVKVLAEQGYENLVDQKGGFFAWSADKNLPVES